LRAGLCWPRRLRSAGWGYHERRFAAFGR